MVLVGGGYSRLFRGRGQFWCCACVGVALSFRGGGSVGAVRI